MPLCLQGYQNIINSLAAMEYCIFSISLMSISDTQIHPASFMLSRLLNGVGVHGRVRLFGGCVSICRRTEVLNNSRKACLIAVCKNPRLHNFPSLLHKLNRVQGLRLWFWLWKHLFIDIVPIQCRMLTVNVIFWNLWILQFANLTLSLNRCAMI